MGHSWAIGGNIISVHFQPVGANGSRVNCDIQVCDGSHHGKSAETFHTIMNHDRFNNNSRISAR